MQEPVKYNYKFVVTDKPGSSENEAEDVDGNVHAVSNLWIPEDYDY